MTLMNKWLKPHWPLKMLGLQRIVVGVLLSTVVLASGTGLEGASLDLSKYPTDEAKGLAIAEAADKRDSGWKDWSAVANMILVNRHGEKSTRVMRMKALEQETDGDKRLIVFDRPRDVKGTAFLVFTKKVGYDDQWLYLPALKRVKRISSRNQSGPFVGSEFAYEDLSSQEVEKYTYKYLKTETVDGMETYVIERIPVDKRSGYTKQIAWIDTEEYRNLRTDYYDRKGQLLKTFTAENYKLYVDNYWRADRFVMNNVQNGKRTDLVWAGYKFMQNLKDSDFNQKSLKRAR